MRKFFLILMALICLSGLGHAQKSAVNSKEVVDAYHYLIGRVLVLRQEHIDFKDEGFEWNKLFPREVGKVSWANPNLDVAYSEAWLAVDNNSCTMIEIPEIKNRYYTFQMLNSWGETVSNINERTFPKHSHGKFALCTMDSKVQLPPGTQRISANGNKFRVLARVELGADPKEAVRLQKQMKVYPTGNPEIAAAVPIAIFDNKHLPGADIFERADAILKSEPDINPGMKPLQEKVLQVRQQTQDPGLKVQVDKIIREEAIPSFYKRLDSLGVVKNGWSRPSLVGNYGRDYLTRSIVNFGGIWANNNEEAVYFIGRMDSQGQPLNGSNLYTMTFPKNKLPGDQVRYFWSVIAVDAEEFHVIPNPLNKFLINNQTKLTNNPDGSVTLVFANKMVNGTPQANWIPTPVGKTYNLTFRFYGPKAEIKNGTYFPPPLEKKESPTLANK